MHTQSRLYYLALAFLLLSQSTLGASPGLACPGCSLKTRQRGGPYENFNPWDDTDFDGTDSTTWLPDDYNGAPDFGSSVGETSGDLALLSASQHPHSTFFSDASELTTTFDSFIRDTTEPTATSDIFLGGASESAVTTGKVSDLGDIEASSTNSGMATFPAISDRTQAVKASNTTVTAPSTTAKPTLPGSSTTLNAAASSLASAGPARQNASLNAALKNEVAFGGVALAGIAGLMICLL